MDKKPTNHPEDYKIKAVGMSSISTEDNDKKLGKEDQNVIKPKELPSKEFYHDSIREERQEYNSKICMNDTCVITYYNNDDICSKPNCVESKLPEIYAMFLSTDVKELTLDNSYCRPPPYDWPWFLGHDLIVAACGCKVWQDFMYLPWTLQILPPATPMIGPPLLALLDSS